MMVEKPVTDPNRLERTDRCQPDADPYADLTDDALQQRAAAGDAGAAFTLGDRLFQKGYTSRAQPWLEQAAQHGHTEAIERLAALCWSTEQHADALNWMLAAAERGSAAANLALAGYLLQTCRSSDDLTTPALQHIAVAARRDPMIRDALPSIFAKLSEAPEYADACETAADWRAAVN